MVNKEVDKQDFAGLNGFVWWVGVVEDRANDPLKLGRVRARILGWHADDKQLLPTNDLPWSQVMLPTNGAKTNAALKANDWVLGFFMDGKNAQMPVIIGVLPGIISETPKTPESFGNLAKNIAELEIQLQKEKQKLEELLKQRVSENAGGAAFVSRSVTGTTLSNQIVAQQKIISDLEKKISAEKAKYVLQDPKPFRDARSPAEVDSSPTLLNDEQFDRKGEPSLNPLARGVIARTGIETSNNNRAHACDVALYIRRSMADARQKTSEILQKLRKEFLDLLKSWGVIPAANGLRQKVKWLASKLKELSDLIQDWNRNILEFTETVRQIRAVIEYILSLPEKLANMFRKCLQQAYAELQKGIFSIAQDILDAGKVNEFESLYKDAKDLVKQTEQVIKNAQILVLAPARILDAATQPSGYSDDEKRTLLIELYPDYKDSYFDPASYSPSLM